MKYKSKELKAMARTQLSGKYGIYIGAYVLYSVITNVVSLIVNFSGVSFSPQSLARQLTQNFVFTPRFVIGFTVMFIIELILSIFSLGFNKMFLDGSRGYNVRFEDLFYGFRHHPDRIILAQLLLELISLACMVPGLAVILCAAYFDTSAGLYLLGVFLILIGCVVLIYFSISFSQTTYLLADYDDIGPVQALKESSRIMSGHKGSYFYLTLSFIGVQLLGVLSCGIGNLWVIPYSHMTHTNFYRAITEEI